VDADRERLDLEIELVRLHRRASAALLPVATAVLVRLPSALSKAACSCSARWLVASVSFFQWAPTGESNRPTSSHLA
jgi:hypothetical protein